MTTFQAIVFGIIHGFTEFLPVSSSAHHVLFPFVVGWPEPSGALLGALSSGTLLAVLVYFRHDVASMVSSVLQIILFRKRPMTLDERLPLFIIAATLPTVGAWYYYTHHMSPLASSPIHVAVTMAAMGLPLWFFESMSRKNKNLYDWNWLDAILLGIAQILFLVPGSGRADGAFIGPLMRNFTREAAAKFTFFTAIPLLAISTFIHLRDVDFTAAAPMQDLSWLSFGVAAVLSFLSGLLAIGGLMKHIQRKGFGQYIVYRFIAAAGVGVVIWLRSR